MDKSEFRRRQLIGVLTGFIGGAVASGYWPGLRAALEWYGVILWGGAIGGILASLPRFGVVGQRITGRDSPALNFIVGTLLLAAIVFVLLTVVGLLLR
jgi:hypothetical protein